LMVLEIPVEFTFAMPLKRKAELFIILGHHKHGKSELYRDLQHHQRVCRLDRFDLAPGARGMVMIAFSMADDDLIYKIIRDRFDTPKRATRRQVASKYDFVFRHDRAGRLLDVQTFDNLCLDLGCLAPALAAELRTQATRTARIVGDSVVFDSVYVERRVTPLDLFLKTAAADAARDAVIDYGNAIKDMARINIFAGDMLIKNFGVTRLGRVVFYDYDELMPLTECRFRRIPPARHVEDDMAAEPWFAVGDNDVFPEEFVFFLGLSPALRDVFMAHHADLLEVTFWRQCQARIHQGDWMPIWPYGPQERLRPAPADQP